METPSVIVALIVLCITVTLLNLVFLRRIHHGGKGRPRWLHHADLIVIAMLVVGLLVVLVGMN